MFTGLVEDRGRIERLQAADGGTILWIAPQAIDIASLAIGESIAHNGACLTVTECADGGYCVYVGEETLRCTTAGEWAVGDLLNLERALRAGDRLGGHFVTGHVDCVATVVQTADHGGNFVIELQVPAPHGRLIAAKGSVAIDGVSLTVNRCDNAGFAVALIPHTRAVTSLGGAQPGVRVNLETDLLAKHIARLTDAATG